MVVPSTEKSRLTSSKSIGGRLAELGVGIKTGDLIISPLVLREPQKKPIHPNVNYQIVDNPNIHLIE